MGRAGGLAAPVAGTGRGSAAGVLTFGGGVALLAIWWAATSRVSGASTGEAITAVGRVTGLLGAYLCLVSLLLMARVPWIERSAGLVRLSVWHRYAGSTALMLILVHVAATAVGYGMFEDRSPLHELGSMIGEMAGMVTATVATGLLVLVGLSCVRAVRARIPYAPWWIVHLTVYAAVVLGFAHQIETGDDFVGRPVAAAVWKGLTIAVLASVAWWRVFRPLADAWARRTRVASAVREGGALSIWLEGDGAGRPGLRGGGFVLVRFVSRGLWSTARPYSITEVGAGDRIRMVVRLRGDRARRLERLRPGTRAIVEGPFGDLDRVRVAPGVPVLLLGAGAGVTPLRPLAADLAAQGHDVVLVHRATSSEDAVLADELRGLAAVGRVVLHEIVGDRASLGRDPLDADGLSLLVPDIASREVVVCTPPALTARLVHAAGELGVSDERLHVGVFAL